MAANTCKRKSARPSEKSKKAKTAEAEGANDRADGANAEARALEGGGVCWVRRRYCLAGITKLGEQVAKNTKLE